jgi:hypothetical protein
LTFLGRVCGRLKNQLLPRRAATEEVIQEIERAESVSRVPSAALAGAAS